MKKTTKYYLVRIQDNAIYYNGKKLIELLSEQLPFLYKRECERIEVIYSGSMFEPLDEKKLAKHNEMTQVIYDISLIPYYLACTGNDIEVTELVTGEKLTSEYPSGLGVREVSKEKFDNYIHQNNYSLKARNYFKEITKEKVKEPVKEEPEEIYNGTAYLSGELNGKPYEGSFTGTLKLKRKDRV